MLTADNLVEESTALLRRLIEALIDFPRDLQVEPREHRGLIHWTVVSNVNDLGLIIGKRGAHAKAIQHLMQEVGRRYGCKFTVWIDPDGCGDRLADDPVRRAAGPTYACPQHRQLLFDLLCAILTERPVIVVERHGTEFDFIIQPLVVQDFDRLQPPANGDERAESIITSLATLFDAAGKRDGVVFRLEVRA